MNSKTFLAGAAFVLLAAAPLAAQADVNLSNGPADGTQNGIGGAVGFTSFGEVFTAPITGTLTSFTLTLEGGPGNIDAFVADWNGPATFAFDKGVTGGLAGLEYESGSTPAAVGDSYTFNPDITVIAGQQYVAFLSTFLEESPFEAGLSTTTSTTPGIDYLVYNTAGSGFTPNWDYQQLPGNALFSANFTSSVVVGGGGCNRDIPGTCPGDGDPNGGGNGGVPEPASWALMILGVGAVGGMLRHRRQAGAFAG